MHSRRFCGGESGKGPRLKFPNFLLDNRLAYVRMIGWFRLGGQMVTAGGESKCGGWELGAAVAAFPLFPSLSRIICRRAAQVPARPTLKPRQLVRGGKSQLRRHQTRKVRPLALGQ